MRYGLPTHAVNTATLGFFASYSLFRTDCFGMDLHFAVSFHSHSRCDGVFGRNWRFSFDADLTPRQDGLAVRLGSGRQVRFSTERLRQTADGASQLAPAKGGDGVLLEYAGHYLYADTEEGRYYLFLKRPQGRCPLCSILDRNGNTIQILFDAQLRIRSVVDPAGRAVELFYNGAGLCAELALPDGRVTKLAYDEERRLAAIQNFEGIPTEFVYGQDALLEGIVVGRRRRTTRVTYRPHGALRLVDTLTDRNGQVTRYQLLSENPETVRVTDPGGNATTFVSRGGRLERKLAADGGEAMIQYENGLPSLLVDPNGWHIQYEYDGRGNPVRRVGQDGDTALWRYDALGRVAAEVGPAGQRTAYEYDERSNLTVIRFPDGSREERVYDSRGNVTRYRLPNGNTVQYEYDPWGNVTRTSDEIGELIAYTWDAFGYQPLAYSERGRPPSRLNVDALDRLRQIVYPDGSMEFFDYDCCAQLSVTDAAGNRWYHERDAMTRIVKSIDPMGHVRAFASDPDGRITQFVDALGRRTLHAYDCVGNAVCMTDALGGAVRSVYDRGGNLAAVTDQNGSTWSFANAPGGITATDPAGGEERLSWGGVGTPVSTVTREGRRISCEYNALGLPSGVDVDGRRVAAIEYNAMGGPVRAVSDAGEVLAEYDRRNRVSLLSFAGRQVAFRYTEADEVASLTYPNGLRVDYEYDARGRAVRAAWDGGSVALEYDARGAVVAERCGNGVESRYEYDACMRVTAVAHRRGTNTVAEMDYAYDGEGNLTEEHFRIPLLEGVGPAVPANRQLRYDRRGSLSFVDGSPCESDRNGNRRTLGSARFHYDESDRLVAKETPAGAFQYAYSALGHTVTSTRDGRTFTRAFDPSGRILWEGDGQGDEHCCVYCGGLLVAVVRRDGVRYLHRDRRGNVAAVTGQDGEAVCAYSYLPYGGILHRVERVADNRYTFLGALGVQGDGDGYFHTGLRCYDSASGRFLQQDPIGFADGYNLYAYAAGNPLARVDPSGTAALSVMAIGAAAIVVLKIVDTALSTKSYKDNMGQLSEDTRKIAEKNKILEVLAARTDFNHPSNRFPSGMLNEEALFRNIKIYERYRKDILDDVTDLTHGPVTNIIKDVTLDRCVPYSSIVDKVVGGGKKPSSSKKNR